ncbi:hypothetical protein FNF31_03875 [Cafeteria roenbergensis]|uniref:Signal recognition particle subunit SRP68 n=1 Tax=Cafeteria roenbergensis TaxID=33653 RepID=A0A5A8D6W9_CAFRO|nr:hypothetical protein FNF31_03875 [Cafeteria roenbergensis]
MASDAAASGDSPARVSLAIIESVRTAQVENGLRHSDFGGYRQYCTRRLRRVRTLRHVKLAHSRGKNNHAFVPRTLRAEAVTSAEHLLVPLFNAERAWAHAMELKQRVDEVVSRGEGSVRPHHHRMRRLRKAAGWAEELKTLCAACADARTALEAEAYSAGMQAQLLSEEQLWDEAAVKAAVAAAALAALAATAATRSQRTYEARASELEPVARFARFQVRREGGEAGLADAEAAAKEEVDALAPVIDAVRSAGAALGSEGAAAAAGAAAGAASDAPAAPSHAGSGDATQSADAFLSPADLLEGRVSWLGAVISAAKGGPTAKALAALAARLHEAASDDPTRAATAAVADADAGMVETAALRVLSSLDDVAMTASLEADKLRRSQRGAAAEDAAAIAAAARWHKDRRLTASAADEALASLAAAASALAGAASTTDASPAAGPARDALRAAAASGAPTVPAAALAASAPAGASRGLPVVRAAALVSLAAGPGAKASEATGADASSAESPAGGYWAQRRAAQSPLRAAVALCDRCARGCEDLEASLAAAAAEPGAAASAAATLPEMEWARTQRSAAAAMRLLALANWHALRGGAREAEALFARAARGAAAGAGIEGAAAPDLAVDPSALLADASLWAAGAGSAEGRRLCLTVAAAASAGAWRCRVAGRVLAAGGGAAAEVSRAISASGSRGSAHASEALAPAVAALEVDGPALRGDAPLHPLVPLPGWIGFKQLHYDAAFSALVPPDLTSRFARRAQQPEARQPAAAAAAAPEPAPAAAGSAQRPAASVPVASPAPAPAAPAAAAAEDGGMIGSLFKMFTG